MTLRAKTRSRKGRDLKRLDGVKRRMTRRRRVRVQKQRGGADDTVKTLTDWFAAVSEMPLYKGELTDYDITDANNDAIKLPPADSNTANFTIRIDNEQRDVRLLAKSVQDILTNWDLYRAGLKAPEFANMALIRKNESIDNKDLEENLIFLANVEMGLRSAKDSTNTSAQQITVDSLADVSTYPLYIWALAYAAPAEEQYSAPALFSEVETRRLVSETPGTASSEGISKPAAQADTAP